MNASVNEANAETLPAFSGGVIAYLQVDGAVKAAEFYSRAFDAKQAYCYPPDEQGRTMHMHLQINGTSVVLCDPYPEQGHKLEAPQGYHLLLPVTNIDAWFERAVAAGCTVIMPVQRMFWGDRYAQVRDPFGIVWAMNEAG